MNSKAEITKELKAIADDTITDAVENCTDGEYIGDALMQIEITEDNIVDMFKIGLEEIAMDNKEKGFPAHETVTFDTLPNVFAAVLGRYRRRTLAYIEKLEIEVKQKRYI